VADLSTIDMLARLGAAAGLGSAIGLERELDSQPAGFRTHLLVGLGSGLFTVAGVGIAGADPSRVAAQVVAGIGFLGAGAILRDGGHIKGLTTAASLWVTASLGLAVGLGRFVAAGAAALLALVALTVLKRIERSYFPHHRGQTLSVDLAPGLSLADLARQLTVVTGALDVREVQRSPEGGQRLVAGVRLDQGADVALIDRILAIEGVRAVDLRA
jgi:putative Mg2+ transporter-C (MgtC) family protein